MLGMSVTITFKPAFADDGQPTAKDDSQAALMAAKKHGHVIMELTVNGHSVDYGVCRIEDYYGDLVDELGLLSTESDHDITMSGYTVGSIRRRSVSYLEVTLHTGDGSHTSSVSADEFRSALKEGERHLKAII